MEQVLTEQTLRQLVQRIIETVHPQQIILFGSAARGEMRPNSDADFLVIVPASVHRRRLAQSIYRNLVGVGFAADIVVVTTDDVKRYREHPGMVIRSALAEGRVVYAS